MNRTHVLGKTHIRIKDNKGNWVKSDCFFDSCAIQSMISARLAKKLKLDECEEDSSKVQKCGYITVDAMVQGNWLSLRDEAGAGTVLVWWVPGHNTSGVCFSKSVLDNTKQTTIVEEVEEKNE